MTTTEAIPVDAAGLTDHALARAAARAAAEVLLRVRRDTVEPGGAAGLGRRGDADAQQAIMKVLGQARPEDAVLSEEAVDDPARLDAERVWIVDPLDGTREFGERDRSDWAVHVALWERGELATGAVALPALGITLTSERPPAVPTHDGPIRIAVSRTRPPSLVTAVAQLLGAELVPLGSAGYKVSAVVRGEADAYVHGGGQFEWDSAAPVAVARAAGLHTSRLDGSELLYNRPDPRLPDLVVCRRGISDVLLQTIREAQ